MTGRLLWLGCLALIACDKQAPTDYHGEPLLRMRGKVELALESDDDPGSLVPALAFYNHEHSELHIVDVDVRGEFPAEFSLDVYLPPPADSFITPSKTLDEPPLAIGFITAVTQEHPETIRFATEGSSTGAAGVDSASSESSWCTADGSECYTETTTCTGADENGGTDCTLTTTGDPQLKEDPWYRFAGLSQNYAVAYLSEAVPADSFTGYVLGATERLAKGYHLIELEPDPDADQEGQCGSEATDLAAQRYNEQHGTDYSLEELTGVDCTGVSCDEEVQTELERLYTLAKIELDCPNDIRVTPVADPEHEPVSVRIAPGQSPLGF